MPVITKNAAAHIRYATIGNVEYRNCHPFTAKDQSGRQWTLVHNVTIFDYQPLNRYVQLQQGDTDSERILLYLVDEVNRREKQLQRRMNEEERFQLLDSIIVEMSKGNKINLLIYEENCFMYIPITQILFISWKRKIRYYFPRFLWEGKSGSR